MLIMCPIPLFLRVFVCLVRKTGTSIIECTHFHNALKPHICHMAILLVSYYDTFHLPFNFPVVSNCLHIPNAIIFLASMLFLMKASVSLNLILPSKMRWLFLIQENPSHSQIAVVRLYRIILS